jgi:hypothetical protein
MAKAGLTGDEQLRGGAGMQRGTGGVDADRSTLASPPAPTPAPTLGPLKKNTSLPSALQCGLVPPLVEICHLPVPVRNGLT